MQKYCAKHLIRIFDGMFKLMIPIRVLTIMESLEKYLEIVKRNTDNSMDIRVTLTIRRDPLVHDANGLVWFHGNIL